MSTDGGLRRRVASLTADPWRRFHRDLGTTARNHGWASQSLHHSIARSILVGNAIWQPVMIAAVAMTDRPTTILVPLAALHLLIAVVAISARDGRVPTWTVVALSYVAFVADWTVADDFDAPLMLAACWMANMSAATPALVMRGRAAIALPLCVALVVPLAMVLTRPEWSDTLPPAVLVTTVSIVATTRIGVSFLVDFVQRADTEAVAAEEQARAAAAQQVASREAAESARVLHDTVINTLAALASGGAAVRDRAAVRERCDRDLATLAALAERTSPLTRFGIRGPTAVPGLVIRQTGLGVEELTRLEESLPADVVLMLGRAVGELLQNSAKHAQCPEATVDVSTSRSGDLRVTVSDEGVGYDGSVPRGRGLDRSVRQRAAGVGVTVSTRTAPGQGTAVTLTFPRAGDPGQVADDPDADDSGFATLVSHLRRRAGLIYAAGASAVGFVLAFSNHRGEPNTEYLMAALTTLATAVTWYATRDGRPLRTPLALALAVAACVAFVLSAAAVDFGRTDVVLWQAICPVGPLIMIVGIGRREGRSTAVAAMVAYAATVAVTAGLVGMDEPAAAANVTIAGLAGLGLTAGWAGFQFALARIGRQASADHAAAGVDRVEAAVRGAAILSRERWRSAGLEASTGLLRGVRDGRVEPDDRAFQVACAEEEAFLRQLVMLSPELTRMGTWLFRALQAARLNGADLIVRAGDRDVAEPAASQLGRLILDPVDAVPPRAQVTTTLFPGPAGTHLTLVAPHPQLLPVVDRWQVPSGAQMSVRTFGDTERRRDPHLRRRQGRISRSSSRPRMSQITAARPQLASASLAGALSPVNSNSPDSRSKSPRSSQSAARSSASVAWWDRSTSRTR